jgi:hypothetical protein
VTRVTEYRNRIVELRKVRGADLKRNPRNWRQHPEGQRSALVEMLASVGFVGAGVGRDTKDGIELIDGHLRADIADDSEMPVLIVDLNEDEAAKVLATFDPLSALAIPDVDAFKLLLTGVELDEHAELRKVVTDITRKYGEKEGTKEDERLDVPGMALQPHEHYDYLVILASTTHEWNVLCDRLDLPMIQRRKTMGLAHAIRADKLIEMLGKKKK